jgi:hypothetical protein
MANEDFLGFADDDRPAPAAAPAGATPHRNANPFADQEVRVPRAGQATEPVPAQRPAQQPVAPPSPAVAAESDADVVPGSRKDLWRCPHCGTGNRPERITCRSCGRSPDAAVVGPWYRRPVVLAGMVCGIAALVAAVVLTRPDLSLRPLGTVDEAPRRGGGGVSQGLGEGLVFNAQGRIAVSGRVLAAQVQGRVTLVALALGAVAREDGRFAGARADLSGGTAVVSGCPEYFVGYLVSTDGSTLAPTAGAWLSLVGDVGTLQEGMLMRRDLQAGPVVVVRSLLGL